MSWVPLWNSGPAQTITANGQGDLVVVTGYSYLGVVLAITGSISGTGTPALNLVLDGYDYGNNAFFLGGFSAPGPTSGGIFAYGIGPGTGNNGVVPGLVRATWQLGGTNPSFGGVQMSFYGRP